MSISALVLSAVLGASGGAVDVPSPGRVLLLAASPLRTSRLLLAQSAAADALDAESDQRGAQTHPDPDEEKALEEDMARARRKVRAAPADASAEPQAAPPGEEPAADERDAVHTHDGGGIRRYERRGEQRDRAEDESEHYDDEYDDDRGSRREARDELLYEDHGWRYYMIWGIVDWVAAGQLWVGSAIAFASMASVLLTTVIVRSTAQDVASIVYGALGVGLGVGGGIVAWRAGVNIGNMRDLKEGRMPD